MSRQLSILLIEDDISEVSAISLYVNLLDDVYLSASTNNANEALLYTQDLLPDAIILDLELHMGSGNGITFLRKLEELSLEVKPYILITTNNTSQITYSQARSLGADFIMAKYQEDYSAKNVIEFLRSLKKSIHSNTRKHGLSTEFETTETKSQLTKRFITRINAELDIIGISPKAAGRKYLLDAILAVIWNPEPNICVPIAKKYNKSDASVERAIQNAINTAWRKTEIEILSTYYTARISSDRGVPTITEFVYYYANKIKNEY